MIREFFLCSLTKNTQLKFRFTPGFAHVRFRQLSGCRCAFDFGEAAVTYRYPHSSNIMNNRHPILPRLVLTALLAVSFGTPFAQAENKTWLSTGNWNTAGNWSPGGVPHPEDDIFTTNTGSIMSLDVSPTVANWSANTAGTAFVVTGTGGGARSLDITGILTKIGTQDITFRSDSTGLTTLSVSFGSISVTVGRVILGGTGAQALASATVTGTTTVNTSSTAGGITVIGGTASSINLGHLDLQSSFASLLLNGGFAASTSAATVTGLTGIAGSAVVAGTNLTNAVSGTLVIDQSAGSSTFAGNLLNYGNNAGGANISTMSLVKDGAGTQILSSGLSSYKGGTTINGGILSVSNLADGDLVTLSSTADGSNVLTVSSTEDLSVGQVVLGLTTGSATPVTITEILSATTVRLSSTAGVSTTANRIFGTRSDLGLATTDASGLVIDGGTLQFTGSDALRASTDRLFTIGANGGGLDASGSVAMSFTNSGAVAFSGSGARTLTLSGTNTGSNTLAAAIGDGTGGATSLVKSGTGKWVLTAASSFTGSTTITDGTLVLSGSDSLASSSAINVSGTSAVLDVSALGTYTFGSTQTVSGKGTIIGNVHIAGTAAPGNSPGIETYTGDVTFDAGSTLALEIAGYTTAGTDYDRLVLSAGNLTLDGTGGGVTLSLDWTAVGTATDGMKLFMVSLEGPSATLTGTFSGLANGASLGTHGTKEWFITYEADLTTSSLTGGNDVAFYTVVPEPRAFALVALGIASLLWRSRVQRRALGSQVYPG